MSLTPFRDNLLSDFFDVLSGNPYTIGRTHATLANARKSSSLHFDVDTEETDTAYIVRADMPGVSRENLEVNLEDGYLNISAERNDSRTEENNDKNYYYSERSFGSFRRSFALPRNVNDEDVRAAYNDGVLTVTIGKRENSLSGRQIKIE